MKCKFCNADLTAEDLLCPICGASQQKSESVPAEEAVPEQTQTEASIPMEVPEDALKKAPTPVNIWKVIAIVACCALVVLLALVIWMGVRDNAPKETTAATTAGTTAPAAVYDTYHGEPAQVLEAADTVVATLGEQQLTNRQLQVFYWTEFYSFVNDYGSYLTGMGLDYTQPLNTQLVPNTEQTWEQFFVSIGLDNWHRFTVLGMEAKKQGMELSEENREKLEQFPALLESNAGSYGYASAEEMIRADYGEGITLDDYLWYLEVQYLGQQYYNKIYDSQTVTREDVSAYFDENAEKYLSYGITKDSGKLLDVRHILIQPEGAEIDPTTNHVTATDAQWEACRAQAQAILDGWAAGEATAESFGALAAKHSVDPGSAENGGLYTGVMQGQMVEAFDTWLFDETREKGHTGLVKTEFGYHIMYFVGGDEGWYLVAKPELLQSKAQKDLDTLLEAYPMESYQDRILLDSAVVGAYKPKNANGASSGS